MRQVGYFTRTSELCLGGPWFKSLAGHSLEVLVGFPQFLNSDAGLGPWQLPPRPPSAECTMNSLYL